MDEWVFKDDKDEDDDWKKKLIVSNKQKKKKLPIDNKSWPLNINIIKSMLKI